MPAPDALSRPLCRAPRPFGVAIEWSSADSSILATASRRNDPLSAGIRLRRTLAGALSRVCPAPAPVQGACSVRVEWRPGFIIRSLHGKLLDPAWQRGCLAGHHAQLSARRLARRALLQGNGEMVRGRQRPHTYG